MDPISAKGAGREAIMRASAPKYPVACYSRRQQ
jgi:hypothetical protein